MCKMAPALSRSLYSSPLTSFPFTPVSSPRNQTRLSHLRSAFLPRIGGGRRTTGVSCAWNLEKICNRFAVRCDAAVAEKETTDEEGSGEKYEYQVENMEVLQKMGKFTGITAEVAVPESTGVPIARRAPVSAHVDGFSDDSLRIMKDIEKVNPKFQVHSDMSVSAPFLVLDENKKMMILPLSLLQKEAPDPVHTSSWTKVPNVSTKSEFPFGKWVHVGCEVSRNYMRLLINEEIVGKQLLTYLLTKNTNSEYPPKMAANEDVPMHYALPVLHPTRMNGAKWFKHNTEVSTRVRKIIEGCFKGPWYSWKKVPHFYRNAWFSTFETKYQWEGAIDNLVRANFEKLAATRLKGMVSLAKSNASKPNLNGFCLKIGG